MNKTLENIFGITLKESAYKFPKETPNYIKYGYDVKRLVWSDKTCIIVAPKGENINLATLKKQLAIIQQLCKEKVIVQLEKLSALQRRNLLESGVAFVAGGGQVFIPFWGCYFEEKIKQTKRVVNKMTAGAQLVFLYLFYNRKKSTGGLNQTQIAKDIKMPKSSFTRAIEQLKGLKLVYTASSGTANKVFLSENYNLISEAVEHMSTPIQKKIYVNKMPKNIKFKYSGIKALSEKSMIVSNDTDAGFAVGRAEALKIKNCHMIDEQDFRDFGGELIEVWKYDPSVLAKDKCVDDISLLLELNDFDDERIQKELDSIRKKYGLYT